MPAALNKMSQLAESRQRLLKQKASSVIRNTTNKIYSNTFTPALHQIVLKRYSHQADTDLFEQDPKPATFILHYTLKSLWLNVSHKGIYLIFDNQPLTIY